MMCLSIAVLCFGVFSAVSVSYSISGTISYTVTDAFVKVNTKVYSGTNQYTTDEKLSTLATNLATGTPTVSASGFTQDTSFSIPEYNSTNGESFEQTNVALTLSSTNKSYLVEMTIQNLSPSVNVWAKANWTLGDTTNIAQGNNSSQSAIAKDSPKCIYFIVSLKDMTQSVSNISYTMGLDIGIGAMPIDAIVDGNVITANEGMTWATFVSNNSDYSTTVEDSVTYVTKDDEILKKNGTKVQITDTIENGAEYKTTLYTLKNSGTYWYLELGKLSDGTPIQWQLVSLDGSTKYTYASTKPSVKAGSIFVQKTYVTREAYGGCNDKEYDGSSIQKYLKGLETFGAENDYGITSDPGYIALYEDTNSENGKVNGDKFWLLTYTQADTFFPGDTAKNFYDGGTGVNWWVRNKDGTNDYLEYVMHDDGKETGSPEFSRAVRAAFQLA